MAETEQQVQQHFTAHARAFDDLYEDERALQRLLRPGIFRRRELALAAVRSYEAPRVLDVGCGSGRIGELILQAGAREWVGVDFSEPMLALAARRLERFGDRARIVHGDFLGATLAGPFEVVVAVGLFDYLPGPQSFMGRMAELCAEGGSLVASFPAWTPLKGPLRKVRYEWVNRCPIFNYSEPQLRALLGEAGFARTEVARGRAGFLTRSWR
ncbi:MAG: methyltransferase domain-containing protein [Acidobacteriota bacterium]|nr:methyltransferase domain-containing protein [Acidobacteriota bacterium]